MWITFLLTIKVIWYSRHVVQGVREDSGDFIVRGAIGPKLLGAEDPAIGHNHAVFFPLS